jgi:hypothetical protein
VLISGREKENRLCALIDADGAAGQSHVEGQLA